MLKFLTLCGCHGIEWNGIFAEIRGHIMANIAVPFTVVKSMDWIAVTVPG